MLLFGNLWVFSGGYYFWVCFVNIVYLRFRGLGIIMQSFDVTPAFCVCGRTSQSLAVINCIDDNNPSTVPV